MGVGGAATDSVRGGELWRALWRDCGVIPTVDFGVLVFEFSQVASPLLLSLLSCLLRSLRPERNPLLFDAAKLWDFPCVFVCRVSFFLRTTSPQVCTDNAFPPHASFGDARRRPFCSRLGLHPPHPPSSSPPSSSPSSLFWALVDAGVKSSDINEVILVGGMARMPGSVLAGNVTDILLLDVTLVCHLYF